MLRLIAGVTTAAIYLQVIVGATMRHSDAGLAIPDFPLVFGGLLPPEWTTADRDSLRASRRRSSLSRSAIARHRRPRVVSPSRSGQSFAGRHCFSRRLVLAQVTLGAFVIWSAKQRRHQHGPRRRRRADARNIARADAARRIRCDSTTLPLPPSACDASRSQPWAGQGHARDEKGSGAFFAELVEKKHPTPFSSQLSPASASPTFSRSPNRA